MREISEKYEDTAVGKALKEAQQKFLKASNELLEANRKARAGNYAATDEVQKHATLVVEAEERMKAAEAEFDLATGGPEPVALTKAVRQKVLQSFPPEQRERVTRLLETQCINDPSSRNIDTDEGLERLRLAVLKVADGSEDELRKQVEAAKSDWRDVISAAEYPEALRLGLVEYTKLSQTAREQIKKRDREQYLAWLGKVELLTSKKNVWRKLLSWKRNT